MGRFSETIINFACYENGKEYVGHVDATLPEIAALTQEISGAGISGNLESVIIGHYAAMSMSINFRTVTNSAVRLMVPRAHKLCLMGAQQESDAATGKLIIKKVKHVVRAFPKKFSPGKLAAASPADASGEFAVSYYALYIDGVQKIEIDPINFICKVNGKDYMKEVRKALGKK